MSSEVMDRAQLCIGLVFLEAGAARTLRHPPWPARSRTAVLKQPSTQAMVSVERVHTTQHTQAKAQAYAQAYAQALRSCRRSRGTYMEQLGCLVER